MTRYTILGAVTLCLAGATPILAAGPFVKGIGGIAENGRTIEINGESFGEKNPARPLIWADFDHNLKPSAPGRVKDWNQVQNIRWSKACEERGDGCAVGHDGVGVWTMRVDYDAWTADRQRFYVFKHERKNFTVSDNSQNWKSWRMWPESESYPNIYAAPNNGRVYVEKTGQESGFWGSFQPPTDEWYSEEIIGKASSGPNIKDGHLSLFINGTKAASGSILTRSDKAPQRMTRNYVVHGVAANKTRWKPRWERSNKMWVDDVYVDLAWSRVLVGDQPTHVGSRAWEIQPPVEWSDSKIKIKFNQGAFQDGQQVYLYVYNQDGVTSLRGYPLQIGGHYARK